MQATSFKVEVIADRSETWAGNGMRYATREQAEESAKDLMSRWVAVREWRVVESDDPPNANEPTIKGAGHRVSL